MSPPARTRLPLPTCRSPLRRHPKTELVRPPPRQPSTSPAAPTYKTQRRQMEQWCARGGLYSWQTEQKRGAGTVPAPGGSHSLPSHPTSPPSPSSSSSVHPPPSPPPPPPSDTQPGPTHSAIPYAHAAAAVSPPPTTAAVAAAGHPPAPPASRRTWVAKKIDATAVKRATTAATQRGPVTPTTASAAATSAGRPSVGAAARVVRSASGVNGDGRGGSQRGGGGASGGIASRWGGGGGQAAARSPQRRQTEGKASHCGKAIPERTERRVTGRKRCKRMAAASRAPVFHFLLPSKAIREKAG